MKKNVFSRVFIFLMLFVLLLPSSTVFANGKNRDVPKPTLNLDSGSVDFNGSAMENQDKGDVWGSILTEYQGVITGISAIAAMTMIAVFIINLMKLAAGSGNPGARAQATSALLWSGIATIGLGAVTLFVGFFYNAI